MCHQCTGQTTWLLDGTGRQSCVAASMAGKLAAFEHERCAGLASKCLFLHQRCSSFGSVCNLDGCDALVSQHLVPGNLIADVLPSTPLPMQYNPKYPMRAQVQPSCGHLEHRLHLCRSPTGQAPVPWQGCNRTAAANHRLAGQAPASHD